MRKVLAYMILLTLPLALGAQEPVRGRPDISRLKQEAADYMAQHPDSARQMQKPGPVFDSTAVKSRQWTLSEDFTTEVPLPLDTAFSLFHRYRVTDKYSVKTFFHVPSLKMCFKVTESTYTLRAHNF